MRADWILLILALVAPWACGVEEGGRGSSPADTDTEHDDTEGAGDAGSDECEGVDFPVSSRPPRALIVLDRSSSMSMSDSVAPWDSCVEALTAITGALDDRIDFGLLLFPGAGETCGPPATIPEVLVAPGTGDAIAAVLEASTPDGMGTPTAAALEIAFQHLVSLEGDEDRFVVLATDGAPNCSDNPSYSCDTCTWTAGNCLSPLTCLDDVGTYSVVSEYHDNWGVGTYVVGVGGVETEWDEVLHDIAAYGGTGDYYPAATADGPSEMIDALMSITAENTPCVFDVDWAALEAGVSQDPDLVNVVVDGETVPFSDGCQNGWAWHWADEDTIELCAALCEDYRWGLVSSVRASFGCETVVE